MRDYHINLFYSEEDEGYIADIPDLKHCSAFGSTPEEALREVLKAREHGLRQHGSMESLYLNLGIVLPFIK